MDSVPQLDAAVLRGYECIAILTDQTGFDYSMIVRHSDLGIDTRNAVKASASRIPTGSAGT